jgi:hypothetical protein
LDQVKGKELQDRVVVEDYRPELNRSKNAVDSNATPQSHLSGGDGGSSLQ